MSVIDDTLRKHRKRIIDREEAAFRELLRAYEEVERELRRQVRELQDQVTAAKRRGEVISPAWFQQERRLQTLIDQVKNQIIRFGRTAGPLISREQQAAIEIAVSQTVEMLSLGSPGSPGSLLNTRAVENAVGLMGDGSPILQYFEEQLAPAVAQRLRSEVIEAAAIGTPFETIAKRLRQAGDITRYRALATARTEVNRVRRETTLQIYQENSDVIEGWEWVASKSPRTCPACLALDGRIFKLTQPFPQHVNCRCTMIPVIIGVPRPPRTIGSEWFDRLPFENQAFVLGVEGAVAYREGVVGLKDFVGWRTDKLFGKSVYTKPLSRVLQETPLADKVVRTPQNITLLFDDDEARERLEELIGDLSAEEIGGLAGALDNAKVGVFTRWEGGVYIEVKHPAILRQVRSLDRDDADRLYMHNEVFKKTRSSPSGIGLRSFATQAYHAEKFGVQYIDTYAAGDFTTARDKGNQWNGYYTWPRFGYNAPLEPDDLAKFPATFRNIRDLNSLFQQVNGKFLWKYHGSSRDMIFDLDRSERSWEILEEYLQERGFTIDFER
jgi:SPP1 gp7 family putative phage head morphogenesis protein